MGSPSVWPTLKRRSRTWSSCSAPTKSCLLARTAFKVYIGHHGDTGAQAGRSRLAGRDLCREARHLREHRGPGAMGRDGGVPAGRSARGLVDPSCGLGVAGKTLPFDSFGQLRARMMAEFPQLGRDGLIDLPWSPPKLSTKAEGPVRYPIGDFFLTNAICRNSPTMQRCSEELVQGAPVPRKRRSDGRSLHQPLPPCGRGSNLRAARSVERGAPVTYFTPSTSHCPQGPSLSRKGRGAVTATLPALGPHLRVGVVPRDDHRHPRNRPAADARGGDDHLCRTQDLGGDRASARAERGRALGSAAELRRRAEVLP